MFTLPEIFISFTETHLGVNDIFVNLVNVIVDAANSIIDQYKPVTLDIHK